MHTRSGTTRAPTAPGRQAGVVARVGVGVTIVVALWVAPRDGRSEDTPPVRPPLDVRVEIPTSESSPDSEPRRHVFGGRRVEIPYRLSGDDDATIDVRVHVSQLTFSLRAPADRTLGILQGTVLREVVGPRSLAIEFPAVERESTFELRFEARRVDQDAWEPIDAVRVQVYPVDLLAEVRTWSKRVQLRLKDDGETLAPLFAKLDVHFLDVRSQLIDKNSPDVTIVADPVSDDEIDAWRVGLEETVIFFRESTSDLPAVLIDRRRGIVIRVGIPVLWKLESDPRSQKLFLEILKLSMK